MTTLKSLIEKENLAKKIENKQKKKWNSEACPDVKKKKRKTILLKKTGKFC